MTRAFWVGRVPFDAADAEYVRCTLCQRRVARSKAAAHAHNRHKTHAAGVLAGQLGLPETNTPDVPA